MSDVMALELEEDIQREGEARRRSGLYIDSPFPAQRRTGFFAEDLPLEGSVIAASFRRDTTIGNLLSTIGPSPFQPRPLEDPNFNPLDVIPDRHADLIDKYVLARNQAEVDDISARLDGLKRDQQLMAQYPWKSFAASFVTQPIDPANWLPGGVLFNNYRKASRVARAASSAAVAGMGSALLQEAVAHQTQQLRTTEESITNVVASGILSGALGGLGAGVSAKNRLSSIKLERAQRDIVTELLGDARAVSDNGTLPQATVKQMPGFVQQVVNFNPLNRLINSPFETANRLASRIFQHNYQALENAEGVASAQSIEANIKIAKRKAAVGVIDAQNVYFEMAGVKPGIGGQIRAKLAGAEMTMGEFSEAVSYILTTGAQHENAYVNKSADILRKQVFDPFKEQAIALNLLPKDVTPKNAMDYFMIVYNKQKILEEGKGGPFVQKLARFYGEIGNQVGEFRKSTFFRENRAQAKETSEQLKKLKLQHRAAREELKDIRSQPMRTRQKESAIKEKTERLGKEVKRLQDNLAAIEREYTQAIKPEWLDSKGKLRKARSGVELRLEAEQTRDKILGNTDGHLLNPQYEKFAGVLSGKPLKERTLLIEQTALRDYQLTDAFKVANMHSRAMAPMIELTRAAREAGFENFEAWRASELKQLKIDFDNATQGKSGKQIAELDKKFKSAVIDLNAGFEMLQGIYGPGPNTLNNKSAEFLSKIKQYNGLRMLGMMTLSSIPDIAIQVFRNGPMRFIQDGLMGTFSEARNIAKQDLRGIGYGVNTWLGTAARLAVEHEGLSTNPGVFSKTFNALTESFGNVTLTNQWNDWNQQMAGHIAINRFLSAAHSEKPSAKDVKRLASLGLTKEDLKIIRDKTVGNVDNDTGARYADWSNWEINSAKEATALDRFQKAVANEIDSIVIEPGLGDKPLKAAGSLGSLLFQFKSFLMASTNKILISGIQRADEAEVYAGVVGMLALGGLSHVVTSFARGQEPKEDPADFAIEAIDKSGVLGIYMEAYNMAAKFGVVPGSGATRYSSRDAAGAFLGPSFGTLSEMIGIVSRVSGLAGEQLGLDSDEAAPVRNLSTRDAETLMRLMPYQNLFYLYRMNKAVTQNAALAAGWDDRRQ